MLIAIAGYAVITKLRHREDIFNTILLLNANDNTLKQTIDTSRILHSCLLSFPSYRVSYPAGLGHPRCYLHFFFRIK